MKSNSKFSLRSRIDSFKYAFKGIGMLLLSEHNMWIHLSISAVVVVLGFCLDISLIEWTVLFLCMGVVLAAEAFNTCIEYLCNRITQDHDPLIGKIKDISAGAVLITSLMAAAIGLLIFGPKLI